MASSCSMLTDRYRGAAEIRKFGFVPFFLRALMTADVDAMVQPFSQMVVLFMLMESGANAFS